MGRLTPANPPLAREPGDARPAASRPRVQDGQELVQVLSKRQGGLIVTIPEPFSPARESSG